MYEYSDLESAESMIYYFGGAVAFISNVCLVEKAKERMHMDVEMKAWDILIINSVLYHMPEVG